MNSETILLRALEPEDLEYLYRWENDSELWQYGSTLTPYSRFTLREYLSNAITQDIFQSRQLRLMIVEKTSPQQPVGAIDLYDFDPAHLRAGVGILIDGACRRKKFGLQALQLVEEYAFQRLMLKQLYAFIPTSNRPSYLLFQKSGYSEAGVLKSWIKTAEGFTDACLMQRLNDKSGL
jgi:diamine N-acetyltransferase